MTAGAKANNIMQQRVSAEQAIVSPASGREAASRIVATGAKAAEQTGGHVRAPNTRHGRVWSAVALH